MCVHTVWSGVQAASQPAIRRPSRSSAPYHDTLRMVVTPLSLRGWSTKTRLKVHTVCCRVHRKRQRLASNGSIESDAAMD